MVLEGVNEAGAEPEMGGRHGGGDTLCSIQYLICNAARTRAESQVQRYIGRSAPEHDLVHQW